MKKRRSDSVVDISLIKTNQVSPISYLIHQIKEAGTYNLTVLNGRDKIGYAQIHVSDEYNTPSVNIDLDKLSKQNAGQVIHLDKKYAYVLLYNSKEVCDYRVVIRKGRNIEFDSRKPQKGDLFSINLLRPGHYNISEGTKKSKVQLTVDKPGLATSSRSEGFKRLNINMESLKKSSEINMLPNQGITIELEDKMKTVSLEHVADPDSDQPSAREELKQLFRSKVTKRKTLIKPRKYKWSPK